MSAEPKDQLEKKSFEDFMKEVINDYKICCISREVSLLARKEVLTGKAKFGITGDGKEVPQVAMARAFKKGDFRSGYYRDQTLMFALGLATVEDFFAQLYADPENDPFSYGRQMNGHFSSPLSKPDGEWEDHTKSFNVSADISPTAGQMARAVGLALASKVYRNNNKINSEGFSDKGNEVCFCTIGDASTSEGVFWESINAAGVLKIPMAVSVWDDGYGISVPKELQTTKGSISELLKGFKAEKDGDGIYLHVVDGWNYAALCETYQRGIEECRKNHKPVVFHIKELTQPQGHSTSGSHERYKSKERLEWEKKFDCIEVMKRWMIQNGIATEEELDLIRKDAKKEVRASQKQAWKNFSEAIKSDLKIVLGFLEQLDGNLQVKSIHESLSKTLDPFRRDIIVHVKKVLRLVGRQANPAVDGLKNWLKDSLATGEERYRSVLYSESGLSAMKVPHVKATYSENSPKKNGFEILNSFFDISLNKYPKLLAFGEDVGHIGDVNQGFAGLQEKHGDIRVFDTGIREWTIIGQGIGMAMRGLRPIAEIQYLDYLLYGLTPLSDDLATLQFRTKGRQKAPLIIRTRGHRLEGIWHTGSPIGMILGAIRGIYFCVPRNMTQAAGFYNTMLQSDDAALIIECLNGYRLKEQLPDNLGSYTVPLGIPETLEEGRDVTLVTYGSCVRVAQEGMKLLEAQGISVELIDVQTLLPFDINHHIVQSIEKTNRVVFMDEDVPGGATAYMMQQVLEGQSAYLHLDSKPKTITAAACRSSYGSEGDYFSKPSADTVFETIYAMMHEADPSQYPSLY